MKRQELLRQLDRDVEGLKGALKDVTERLTKLKEEEESGPRVLGPKEIMRDGDYVFWGNTPCPATVSQGWGIGMEVNELKYVPNTIVVRP